MVISSAGQPIRPELFLARCWLTVSQPDRMRRDEIMKQQTVGREYFIRTPCVCVLFRWNLTSLRACPIVRAGIMINDVGYNSA